jgi:hypothetical protein
MDSKQELRIEQWLQQPFVAKMGITFTADAASISCRIVYNPWYNFFLLLGFNAVPWEQKGKARVKQVIHRGEPWKWHLNWLLSVLILTERWCQDFYNGLYYQRGKSSMNISEPFICPDSFGIEKYWKNYNKSKDNRSGQIL